MVVEVDVVVVETHYLTAYIRAVVVVVVVVVVVSVMKRVVREQHLVVVFVFV